MWFVIFCLFHEFNDVNPLIKLETFQSLFKYGDPPTISIIRLFHHMDYNRNIFHFYYGSRNLLPKELWGPNGCAKRHLDFSPSTFKSNSNSYRHINVNISDPTILL